MDARELILEVIKALLEKHDRGITAKVSITEKILKPYKIDAPLGISVSTNKLIKEFVNDGVINIRRIKNSPGFSMITLADKEKALSLVDYKPLSNRITDAFKYLDSTVGDKTVYNRIRSDIKEAWEASKLYSRLKPEDYKTLADTILGVDFILKEDRNFEHIDYRHISVKLYNDSKRFDTIKNRIAKMIDELSEEPIGLDTKEILSSYGVSPIAHPVYLSGPIILCSGKSRLDASFPDSIGVWPNNVEKIIQGQFVPKIITTIENQATFQKYVTNRKENELVIYTAGIPSPSFRKFYSLIVSTFPSASPRHWGDIDLGGFIILGLMEKTAGKIVSAYRMHPSEYIQNNNGCIGDADKRRMLAINLSARNKEILNECVVFGMKFEQEAY